MPRKCNTARIESILTSPSELLRLKVTKIAKIEELQRQHYALRREKSNLIDKITIIEQNLRNTLAMFESRKKTGISISAKFFKQTKIKMSMLDRSRKTLVKLLNETEVKQAEIKATIDQAYPTTETKSVLSLLNQIESKSSQKICNRLAIEELLDDVHTGNYATDRLSSMMIRIIDALADIQSDNIVGELNDQELVYLLFFLTIYQRT